MIKLKTALSAPIEVEIDDKTYKFSYLTLGDYDCQGDFRKVALTSLKKLQPLTTEAFVNSLPLDDEEFIELLVEVAGMRPKKKGDKASSPNS